MSTLYLQNGFRKSIVVEGEWIPSDDYVILYDEDCNSYYYEKAVGTATARLIKVQTNGGPIDGRDWVKPYPCVKMGGTAFKVEGWVEPTPSQPQSQSTDWFWEMLNNGGGYKGGAYNPPTSTPPTPPTPTSTPPTPPTPTPTPTPAPNPHTREGMKEILIVEGKSGYRRLALLHHPDKGGDVGKFRLLTELWEVIK